MTQQNVFIFLILPRIRFLGRYSYNFFVVFLEYFRHRNFILKLTDLYIPSNDDWSKTGSLHELKIVRASSTLKATLPSPICLWRMAPLGSRISQACLAVPWLLSKRSNFRVRAWLWSAKMGKGRLLPKQVSSKSFVVQATCVSPVSVEQARIWK